MKDASQVLSSQSTLKPPLKRRRLLRSRTPSPASNSSVLKPSNSVASMTTATNKGISIGAGHGIPVCTSCHRASPTGNTIQCAVCSSTTCAVCSRRCTHSAASQPPTPYLTWSPSPSPSPAICGSPRRSRSVLSLVNFPNTDLNPNLNLHSHVTVDMPLTPTQNSVAGARKRRKIVDDDSYDLPRADVLAMSMAYTNTHTDAPKDRLLLSPGEIADERWKFQDESEYGPGCARLVCRRCCYEDVASNTTTCLECYGSFNLTRP